MTRFLVAAAVLALFIHTLFALPLVGAVWSAVSAGANLGPWPAVWLLPLATALALVVRWVRAAIGLGSVVSALGTLSRPASAVALIPALTYGVYLAFGPTGIICGSVTTFRPATTPGPGCVTQSGIATFGLLPVPFLAVWSLAPLLAILGTWLTVRPVPLVALALLVELAAFLPFFPFRPGVSAPLGLLGGPPLLLALLATLVPRRPLRQ